MPLFISAILTEDKAHCFQGFSDISKDTILSLTFLFLFKDIVKHLDCTAYIYYIHEVKYVNQFQSKVNITVHERPTIKITSAETAAVRLINRGEDKSTF